MQAALNAATSGPSMRHISSGAVLIDNPCKAYSGKTTRSSPALQSVGVSQGYYLFGAVPYVLTLVILVISCRPGSVARGSPGELSSVK